MLQDWMQFPRPLARLNILQPGSPDSPPEPLLHPLTLPPDQDAEDDRTDDWEAKDDESEVYDGQRVAAEPVDQGNGLGVDAEADGEVRGVVVVSDP